MPSPSRLAAFAAVLAAASLSACDKARPPPDGLGGQGGGACARCHGSATSDAPPTDTAGASTGVRVGAHQAHLLSSSLRASAIACAECHPVPGSPQHSNLTVDLAWGGLASAGGVLPLPVSLTGAGREAWEASPTCTNYCHGASFTPEIAGSATSPSWTGASVATACGACHQAPPATAAHAAVTGSTNCGSCHSGFSCTTDKLAACTVDKAKHLNGAIDTPTLGCTTCHGSTANPAPPVDTAGASTGVKTGAHQAHLAGTRLRATTLACADCHTVPGTTTHASGIVDMAWGPLARTGGLSPAPGDLGPATSPTQAAWEASPTCTNYCHGGGFPAAIAGRATAPAWTGTAASAASCDACHQAPPANAAHVAVGASTQCGACHEGYACTAGNLAACTVDKARHLNGLVDAPTLGCTTCHGSAANPAPPVDTAGAATGVKVGAHQAHLVKSNLRAAVLACADCHTVPTSATHASGTVDMTWSALARTGGLTPTPGNLTGSTRTTWEASPTCANYCHGAGFAAGIAGTGTRPSWTGAAVATACGSCHAAPPGTAGHASVTATTNCGTCHSGYTCTTANLAACTVDKARHLNGVVDVPTLGCTSCHGSTANAAPPIDTAGAATGVRVGAHQAHLVKSNLRSAVLACVECHTVPGTSAHASGTVDMTWGALARTGGLTPTPGNLTGAARTAWEATPTCTNYCHGSGFPAAVAGGTTAPAWTGSATATACNGCHKAPPATAAHAAVTSATSCATCHTGYTCTSGNLAGCSVNKAAHLDGNVDVVTLGCTTCHGSAANPAPPVDTAGASTGVRVGAHQAHLVKANLRATALACADCHSVPSSMTHASGTVDLAWSALARTGGLTATPASLTGAARTAWEATPTCANYCHGAGFAAASRGTGATPSWTGAAVATACGSCHKAPPTTASHASVTPTTTCGGCHAGYACTTANLAACTVNKATHLNGAVDAPSLTCTSCHGSAANPAPPLATSGASTGVKVGAHQAHLVKSNLRAAALACAECHAVPSAIPHASGVVEMAWGALARTGGLAATPGNLGPATTPTQAAWEAAPTCANYCHGAGFAAGIAGSATRPSWTGAAVNTACGSCHAAPPSTAGHASVTATTSCATCHTGYACTTANLAACTVNKTLHLNGLVDAPSLTCTSCHGSATNPAPPVATTGASTGVKVGAHQAHLVKSNLRSAVLACADCHTVPSSAIHASGLVDLTWGTLARTGGFTATPGNLGPATTPTQAAWEASPTCANYCHGAGFAAGIAGSATRPSWIGAAVNTACGACHAAPPTTAGHASVTATTSCATCHTGYACTTANLAACTVNKTLHLNGAIDAPSLTCTSCHGSAANPAPPVATSATNGTVKVGAHQAHLVKTNLRTAALACADCHTVPSSMTHASATVDMTWSALARTGGLTPTPGNLTGAARTTWEGTPTCTNYCHGAGFAAASRGTGATPSWIGAAVATACGSCHRAPPTTAGHSSVTAATNCGSCHTGYACTTANLAACTVNKATHLNGAVEAPTMTCTSCHGSAANPAPPVATSATNGTVKVGAHQAHLVKTNLRTAALACADCHTVPSSTTHASGIVEFTWSALARTGGLTATPASLGAATTPTQATWEGTPTCANYCHGAGFDAAHAGSATRPSWTGAAVATACSSCHKAPPTTAGHASVTASTNCGSCHTGYSCTTANLAACTVNKATHLNGSLDAVNLTCTSCHGNPAQSATAASPRYAAPPVDTASLASGGFRIGAHQAHLTGTRYRSTPITCQSCHASVGTYTNAHASGVRNVGFTGASPAAFQTGTWTASTASASGTCASSGCHNVTSRTGQSDGAATPTPAWTGTISGCTACHSVTMTTLSRNHTRSAHRNYACSVCHGTGYSTTAVVAGTHMDGTRTVATVASGTGIRTWNASTGSCTASCHGSENW